MKTFNKASLVFVSGIACALALVGPMTALAATTPSLGAAASFGILAHTLTSTTIPFGANVVGDMGYATSTGVTVFASGLTHVNDAIYAQAGADQHTALAALNSQACTFTFGGAVDLATDTSHGALGVYTPGVYCSAGAMSIGGGATISLSGAGTFIFRPAGTLTTTDFSIATTTNDASPCDVFWTPQTPPVFPSTVLGSDTRFVGTVIEPIGPTNADITVGGGTSWIGRALAWDWTVTTNPVIMKYVTITVPTCPVPPVPPPAQATLHVIKHVINNDGGTATASSFTLHVMGSGMMGISDVAGSPAAGVESPGTSYTLAAGTYAVSENASTGYTQSFSGDCDGSGNVALASGDNKTCTITNDDIAPPVVVPPVIVPPVVVPPVVVPPVVVPPVVVPPVVTLIPDPASTSTPPVPAPTLPNTGFPPEEGSSPGNLVIPAAILLAIATSLAVVLRKRAI